MRFWDSSALVGLVVSEQESPRLDRLIESDPHIGIWWATRIEGASALCRLEREGRLDAKAVGECYRDLVRFIESGTEVQPSDTIRDFAVRLLRVHPIRAAAAMQLAAAVRLSEDHPPSLEFVCMDARLLEAASREGFKVLP